MKFKIGDKVIRETSTEWADTMGVKVGMVFTVVEVCYSSIILKEVDDAYEARYFRLATPLEKLL